MAGVYVHIPFCKQACLYCDFHFTTNLNAKEELLSSLIQEIILRKNYLTEPIQTIYVGGGTPSVFTTKELEKILNCLHANLNTTKVKEITIECNPDDLSLENLKGIKQIGFNRLSVGIQSFLNEELKWMNRAHTVQESVNCIKLAQDTGFSNISIDLIYGSKYCTMENWEKTLARAIALNVQHISAYNLTIETKTKLGSLHQKLAEPSIDDKISADEFIVMCDMLENAGFIHYEISNFALPGFVSQHNSAYWFQKKYLGIGPSAHSFNGTERQWNVRSNAAYIQALKKGEMFFEKEILSEKDKYNEYVMTSLRTMWGCNTCYMRENFPKEYLQEFDKVMIRHPECFIKDGVNIKLTKQGKLKADHLASSMFVC